MRNSFRQFHRRFFLRLLIALYPVSLRMLYLPCPCLIRTMNPLSRWARARFRRCPSRCWITQVLPVWEPSPSLSPNKYYPCTLIGPLYYCADIISTWIVLTYMQTRGTHRSNTTFIRLKNKRDTPGILIKNVFKHLVGTFIFFVSYTIKIHILLYACLLFWRIIGNLFIV